MQSDGESILTIVGVLKCKHRCRSRQFAAIGQIVGASDDEQYCGDVFHVDRILRRKTRWRGVGSQIVSRQDDILKRDLFLADVGRALASFQACNELKQDC